mmetsp:Transcript_20240/g.60437  ORF Transcript_20240/g.60437 Transcript_20240/m.60437 type:complete len:146 (+) Transcript_20240:1240-1677(+)
MAYLDAWDRGDAAALATASVVHLNGDVARGADDVRQSWADALRDEMGRLGLVVEQVDVHTLADAAAVATVRFWLGPSAAVATAVLAARGDGGYGVVHWHASLADDDGRAALDRFGALALAALHMPSFDDDAADAAAYDDEDDDDE